MPDGRCSVEPLCWSRMIPRLSIFARFPTPGMAKTRLIPAIGADAAARVHRLLVERAVATARDSGLAFEVRVTGAPRATFAGWLGEDVALVEQGDGDLGARLARVPAPAILIGSDAPGLTTTLLTTAATALSTHRAVIGPALDGGYILLGSASQSGSRSRTWPGARTGCSRRRCAGSRRTGSSRWCCRRWATSIGRRIWRPVRSSADEPGRDRGADARRGCGLPRLIRTLAALRPAPPEAVSVDGGGLDRSVLATGRCDPGRTMRANWICLETGMIRAAGTRGRPGRQYPPIRQAGSARRNRPVAVGVWRWCRNASTSW